MTILPSFQGRWGKTGKDKPRIRILEVRSRKCPEGGPIAWILVERDEHYEWDRPNAELMRATLQLSYEMILPKYDGRWGMQGSFDAGYRPVFNVVSLSSQDCSSGALFLDLSGLEGNRIGTYLMNEIVEWVKQWPDATVNSIHLRPGQSSGENKERRNRFYEQFGLVFDYTDPATREEGCSRPMRAKDLVTVDTWKENIREMSVLDYLAETIYQMQELSSDTRAQKEAIKSLVAERHAAERYPIWWACKTLWRKYFGLLVSVVLVAGLAAVAWLRFRV